MFTGVRFARNPVWNQVLQLQEEMNRLFERWSDGAERGGRTSIFPPVNLWEDAEALYLEAELPGLNLKDLEIFVTGGNQLTLKGNRNGQLPEKGVWHRQERGRGSFERVVALPVEVNPDRVEARLENGVLVVKLAKHESAKPRRIVVKAE